eukprot:CAMPEP_0170468620 /NCGR_PEP_ID=MMETSP0123-20130129/11729_1 /TAXON_ID=182087 /ORGANISM="Favella ehrenbergii, Strain Fehren 1" /LENGTH=49 /DNA_ID=CAMNT_0010735229 /DNA_START=627 /DNA_END=776 /DNA_ORIENTATION=+
MAAYKGGSSLTDASLVNFAHVAYRVDRAESLTESLRDDAASCEASDILE